MKYMKLPQFLSAVIFFSVFLTACESIPDKEQMPAETQTEELEKEPDPVVTHQQQWLEGKQKLLTDLRSNAHLRVQEPDEESIYIQIRSTDSFITGGTTPSSALLTTLEHIAVSVEGHDYIEILVSGHTDNLGNAQRNRELSAARAKVVADYLVEKGVRQPMAYMGSGSEQPVASNATREGRAVNRRIDLLIRPSPDEVF